MRKEADGEYMRKCVTGTNSWNLILCKSKEVMMNTKKQTLTTGKISKNSQINMGEGKEELQGYQATCNKENKVTIK